MTRLLTCDKTEVNGRPEDEHDPGEAGGGKLPVPGGEWKVSLINIIKWKVFLINLKWKVSLTLILYNQC